MNAPQVKERTEEVMTLELEPRQAQPLATITERQSAANAPLNPTALIELAMKQGDADLDRLERLLKMQQEWRMYEREEQAHRAKLAYRDAFVAFRAENVIIPKTKHVQQTARSGGPGPSFWQSEFDVVCSMLTPALAKHGLSFRHDQRFGSRPWAGIPEGGTEAVTTDVPWVYVTCYLEHRDGHFERLDIEGPPDSSGAKNPLQEMQAAATYLKRQSLMALTGTAAQEEDDETRKQRRCDAKEQENPTAAAERQKLIDDGQAAAMEGMKALTAWWGGLNARQQKDLTTEFGAMRRAARLADEGGGK